MEQQQQQQQEVLQRMADDFARSTVEDIVDMAERVDAMGNVGFLVDPLWPADAYGILAAQDKAGKTWMATDLAVSIASETPWVGHFPVQQGGVLMYCGEGGARNIVRRVRAVAEHKGVAFKTLRGHLRVSERAPRIAQKEALEVLDTELRLYDPRCVIIDPLYLAAAGGKGSDLYAMGEVLQGAQQLCQQQDAALVLTHHWNKTGTGAGAQRMTGVGPGAWGRVLGSGEVVDSRRDGDKSVVDISWEFVGSEIPETRFGVTRTVWADDQHDLSSALHYEVEVMSDAMSLVRTPPSERRVREALEGAPGRHFTRLEIERATSLHKSTVKEALVSLVRQGVAQSLTSPGVAGQYWVEGRPLTEADDS